MFSDSTVLFRPRSACIILILAQHNKTLRFIDARHGRHDHNSDRLDKHRPQQKIAHNSRYVFSQTVCLVLNMMICTTATTDHDPLERAFGSSYVAEWMSLDIRVYCFCEAIFSVCFVYREHAQRVGKFVKKKSSICGWVCVKSRARAHYHLVRSPIVRF